MIVVFPNKIHSIFLILICAFATISYNYKFLNFVFFKDLNSLKSIFPPEEVTQATIRGYHKEEKERNEEIIVHVTPYQRVVILKECCSTVAENPDDLPNVKKHRKVSKLSKSEINHYPDNDIKYVPLGDEMISEKAKEEWKARPHSREVYEKYGGDDASSVCVPMAKWHSQNFLNCNTIHETDLKKGIVKKKANGFYRDVWVYKHNGAISDSQEEMVALKTIRVHVSHSPHRMEQQRIDAMATERLTSSPHVIDVYGYCGYSTINGLASSGFDRSLKRARLTSLGKLVYARDAALALADAHSIDGGQNATLIHRDIRASNFLLSKDRKYVILHDFNLARFPTWNIETNSPCGFLKAECTEYRSPEECLGKPLTEKIDVYSLGNVFYFILTRHHPYSYPKMMRGSEIPKSVVRGIHPVLPRKLQNSDDPAMNALVNAMKRCFTYDPRKRPSAREIADELSMAMQTIRNKSKF